MRPTPPSQSAPFASAPSAEELVLWGQQALRCEGEALCQAAERLGPAFAQATSALLACSGKVCVTGLGKSGHVARKIASTLSSTGTAAFFLHPSEALHGDFGVLRESDCLLAIAFGGETAEVVDVAKFARRIGVVVIAITGVLESSLARLAHHVIDGSVVREACPMNLAPTTSSTLALALGDALAVALIRARGFSEKDFASLHPAGSLGRKLSLVSDHMHAGASLPLVHEETGFHEVLETVTRKNFGIAAVISRTGELLGAITDGDLRRALLKHDGAALRLAARDIMTAQPKLIAADALAIDAVRLMELHRVTALFVTASAGGRQPIGLVRMHDLLTAKIV